MCINLTFEVKSIFIVYITMSLGYLLHCSPLSHDLLKTNLDLYQNNDIRLILHFVKFRHFSMHFDYPMLYPQLSIFRLARLHSTHDCYLY